MKIQSIFLTSLIRINIDSRMTANKADATCSYRTEKNNTKQIKSIVSYDHQKAENSIVAEISLRKRDTWLGSLDPAKWESFGNFLNLTVARTLFPIDLNETTERINLRLLPFRASLTAHSPTGTLLLSPAGPIAMVMAVGIPVDFRTSTTHSASSVCSKNYENGEQKMHISNLIWRTSDWIT